MKPLKRFVCFPYRNYTENVPYTYSPLLP